MNNDDKDKRGQYITSKEIVDLMVLMISTDFIYGKILEPCFGTGVFLDLLYKSGFQNVYGYELDENFFKIVQKKFPEKISNFIKLDYLKSSQNEKFDIIIGNPPYVYYNNIEPQILELLLKNQFWQKLVNGEWDLLYFFIVWSIEKLNPSGELIFITPYYWFNSTYASSLRKYMKENGSFDSIFHFGEMNLFKGCAPNTIIFKFIKEETNKLIKVVEYKKRKGDVKAIVRKLKDIFIDFPNKEIEDESYRIFYMNQFDNPFFWYLIKPSEKELCDLIENATLKNVPELIIHKNTLVPKKILLNSLLDEKDLLYFNLDKKKYHPVIKNRKKWYSIPSYENNYLKLKHILTVSVGMVTGFDKAFRINEDEYNL
ncbi:MAG: Eco57I restriction-modification methylase domain-containing protein, partial [Promethearchaeota archaeon]